MKQDPCLILHTKINSKWIVNLNIRPVNCKTPKIKYREWSPLYWFWQCFAGFDFESKGFPGGSAGKESACKEGNLGLIPGLGRSPGEQNSYHSSVLAWRIPWMEEPGGLQSMRWQRVGHNWATFTFHVIKGLGLCWRIELRGQCQVTYIDVYELMVL